MSSTLKKLIKNRMQYLHQ